MNSAIGEHLDSKRTTFAANHGLLLQPITLR